MGKSNINYLTDTFSPISGCSGKGCKVKARCWAMEMVKRFPSIHGHEAVGTYEIIAEPAPFNQVRFHQDRLNKPLHWKKPRRVGMCFCGDWMDDQVQCEWIDDILEVIAACPQHQFLSLTKNPQNLDARIYGDCLGKPVRELGGGDYLPNLWNGVSVCDQEDADWMIPELLKVPGKHWISAEPLIGPISFAGYDGRIYRPWLDSFAWSVLIDLIVVGCESGPNRRPCKLEWVESIVKQCQFARVPVFVKQLDIGGKCVHDIDQFPESLRIRQFPEHIMGNHPIGNLLDVNRRRRTNSPYYEDLF